MLLAGLAVLALTYGDAEAQRRARRAPAAEPPAAAAPGGVQPPAVVAQPATSGPSLPTAETVQADVSTRDVSVTSNFTGTEIVVFGAVDNSQQETAESGLYDIVIVVEGTPSRVVARRKSNVAGLWLNTSSATFDTVPSYYAIASTRPLEEIAPKELLELHKIGVEHVRMTPAFQKAEGLSTEELKQFRESVIRLKQKEGLYVQEEYGVAFIGRSLFRSTIELPANVTVGPFDTRVYLFRDEKLLSQYTARLNLQRQGLERHLHAFAFRYPFFYGLTTVLIAVGAGLLASVVFRRPAH
jgi:uncharacterized protein (TIGR02186 family)